MNMSVSVQNLSLSLYRCSWGLLFSALIPLFGLGIRIHYVFNLSIRCVMFFCLKNNVLFANAMSSSSDGKTPIHHIAFRN